VHFIQAKFRGILSIRRLYGLLGPRAYTVMMFSAIFFTLTVKFFHSYRTGMINEYFGWILADIAVLLESKLSWHWFVFGGLGHGLSG